LEAGCWENEEGSSHSPAFLGFHLGLKVSMEARLTKQRLQDRETGELESGEHENSPAKLGLNVSNCSSF
jgi:hypothetical protein